MINLDELLFQAYTLGVETDDKSAAFTKAQLRSVLFRSVPLLGKAENGSDSSDHETEKPAKKLIKKAAKTESEGEKKSRKPRAVEDDARCHARTFNEHEHLENGKPKIMNPDDEHNQYGGRCSAKKNGESDFCKMHSEKQAHGVWGGAFGEKCNKFLEQPEKEGKPKKTNAKKVIKKAPKVEAEGEDNEDDVEEHDDDEYMSSVNKLEEAKVEYDWLDIDGEDYMIDAEGNVYDPESEEKLGKYDTKAKKWISGGPKEDDE